MKATSMREVSPAGSDTSRKVRQFRPSEDMSFAQDLLATFHVLSQSTCQPPQPHVDFLGSVFDSAVTCVPRDSSVAHFSVRDIRAVWFRPRWRWISHSRVEIAQPCTCQNPPVVRCE